jgi:hypothetical protein
MQHGNITRVLIGVFVATAACPPPAMARVPYIVDDAGITDKGSLLSTTWLSHSDKGENIGTVGLAYQYINNLETTVQAGRDIGNGSDDSLFTFQEKYLWHTTPSWQSSLTGGLTYDTAQQELSGAYAYVPVTFSLTPIVSLNLDLGWQYSHPDDQNNLTWGANVSVQATKTISFTAEEFGKSSGLPGQQLGIGWQPEGQIFVGDIVYGHDITGTTGQWLTTAITLTF